MATPRVTPFSVPGADGLPLRGNLHTAARPDERRPAIVICHGFKGFKDWGMFPVVAQRLALAGFTAVRFNFSGSGVSDGDTFDQPERFRHDTYSRQLSDLGTVLDWLEVPVIGVLGHSRGGGVAILRAASDRRLGVLVTWAAIASPRRWDEATVRDWRRRGTLDVVNARTGDVLPLGVDLLEDLDRNTAALDIEAAAGRVSVPWLIVHGSEDEAVPVAEAKRLARGAGGGTSRLVVIEGGSHTFGARHPWAGPTPEFDRALDTTVEWFGRYLTGPE